MDRVRTEIVAPYVISDRQREARREALLSAAASASGRQVPFSAWLAYLLVRAGCRLDALGRRNGRTVSERPLALNCACAE